MKVAGGEVEGAVAHARRLAAIAIVAACACTTHNAIGPSATESSATIGVAGGHVATADGSIDVFIPYGALASTIVVSVQEIASPASGSVGPVFEISPSGTTFSKPVVLTFRFGADDLAGADPETLSVATFSDGQWRLFSSRTDAGAGTVAADVTHFSPWALVL